MIWGIEGRHQWNGGLILNQRVDDDGVRVLPRYKVRRVTGLQSLGDSEDVRELAVGREGEIPRRSFRRGKTVTYEGDTEAETLGDLRQAEAELRAAFDDQRTEEVMEVTPHPDYDPSGATRFFRARALALEDPDEQGPPVGITHGFKRAFALSVRLSDRRYYDGTEQTESVFVEDGADVETVVCANGGTVATDPVLTLSSPAVAGWDPVLYAATEDLPADASLSGQLLNPAPVPGVGRLFIDGAFPELNDRVLLTAQSDAKQNGLWRVAYPGAPTGSWVLTRVADADATAEFAHHKTVEVLSGFANQGKVFEQTTAGAVTIDTTDITFAEVTSIIGVIVTNETVGASLRFPSLVLFDGHELVIDFRTRRITKDGVDSGALLEVSSDWWDAGVAGLAPGNNTIRMESYSGEAGEFDVTCEVAWHDAFV